MSQINEETVSSKRRYWRGFGELANTSQYQSFLHREFQEGATELKGINRRSFLKLLGGTAAFAGLTGCDIRRPSRKIIPYSRQPEHIIPGHPLYYATAMAMGEDVTGVLVESHEGRPTKIEGNPNHPQSLGKANHFHQASLLDLYDPDRLRSPLYGRPSFQEAQKAEFETWLDSLLMDFRAKEGEGLAVLTQQQMSPSFYRLVDRFQKLYPKARIFRYEPVHRDALYQGIKHAAGQWLCTQHHFDKANVVVSFGSDFLGLEPGNLLHTQGFSQRRDPDSGVPLNRLYVIEPRFTITGGKADHRLALSSIQMEQLLWQIALELLNKGEAFFRSFFSTEWINTITSGANLAGELVKKEYLEAIVEDLWLNRGNSILIGGRELSVSAHSVIFLVNAALGNIRNTISVLEYPFSKYSFMEKSNRDSIQELSTLLENKVVSTLFILGGNPVFTAPADLNFSEKMLNTRHVVYLTSEKDETAEGSTWIVPRSHYLEAWGDLKGLDGVESIVQPLIQPLVNGYSDLEFLAKCVGEPSGPQGYDVVRNTYKPRLRGDFDKMWKHALHQGVVEGISLSHVTPKWVKDVSIREIKDQESRFRVSEKNAVEVVIYPSSSLYDGRFANNGWLQELPDPVTKLTWDNAAWISPQLAKRLKVNTQDMIRIKSHEFELETPVVIVPGQASESVALFMGYGRRVVGRIGASSGKEDKKGFNVFALYTGQNGSVLHNVEIVKTGSAYVLATTQEHSSLEARNVYRETTVHEYRVDSHVIKEMDTKGPSARSIWKEKTYEEGYQWGMAIDLSKCTGCNACILACQSENNIPIVGKSQILNGREMHWLRTDRYFEGEAESARMVTQPVPCLQCENAPCEQVCPVAATTHSEEGLNDMAYNRCVGTRYCSNNCPAKVRRFNYFDFHQRNPQAVKKVRKHLFDYIREPDQWTQMQFNPDVTVRMRGVMEKCTYCVQRINESKFRAKNENRQVKDGEIQTACSQT